MTNQVVRTYKLPHRANAVKLARIAAVLPEYQRTMHRMQAQQMRRFYAGEGFWGRANCKFIPSCLSARYKNSCQKQTVKGLLSWQQLTKEQFRKHITQSSLSEGTKALLYRVNVRAAWYQGSVELPELDERGEKSGKIVPVPDEVMRLARQLVKHIRRRRNQLPDLGRSQTMCLDGTVAQVEQSKTNSFDYWVRVSTLEKGKPCWVPLKSHRFFNEAPGEVRRHCQVRVDGGDVSFSLLKSFDVAPARTEGGDIGLDYGLQTLFASNSGDLLGRSLYPWLQEIDQQLLKLTANLQRQGIQPTTSKRYRRFQARIRGYVENEVNRCLNRVIEIHQPKSISLEKLDFRYGGLSPRLNRILARAGRSVVKSKLKVLHETMGIEVIQVNPAYTSQECAGCGFVTKTNRKDNKFHCQFCGKIAHADTNGAKTILRRSQSDESWLYVGKDEILRRLEERFQVTWGVDFATVQTRTAARRSDLPTPKRRRATGSLPTRQLVGIAAN